jgi:Leucine-rich repeat (LRR) protein
MVYRLMKYYLHTSLILAAFILLGCDGYIYTFNKQPVFDPPILFSDYKIPDPALNTCIDQAIIDQQVVSPDKLTQLNCSSAGITDLTGLEIFSSLTHINLSQNSLVEIKPLLFLSHPTVINLENNDQLFCADGQLLAKLVSDAVKLPSHCKK